MKLVFCTSKTNQTRWEWHHNTHTIPEHCTQHCLLHSLYIKDNSYLHSTISAYKSLPCSCSIATTLQPPTAYLTPRAHQPTPPPSTTFLCTQITSTRVVGKIVQDAGMLWKCCRSNPISSLVGFWEFHPYMHLFSFRKLFCVLNNIFCKIHVQETCFFFQQ